MKDYSLALGGGAARGFVHLGVWKYLEEKNIKISEVAGTSMGAIIASFISIGKTSEYTINFAKNINLLKLIDIDFKLGLLKGDKIYKLLKSEFGDMNIEDTPIPLKIVATNIEKGEVTIFDKGKIVDALRASFSLPGIFKPYKIGDYYYVDGGVMMNLPVQALEKENILAVSALKIAKGSIETVKQIGPFKIKSGFIKNNFRIISRSVQLLMKANEDISLQTKGKNISFLRPNFGELDILDFKKVDEFVKLGYEEIQKIL